MDVFIAAISMLNRLVQSPRRLLHIAERSEMAGKLREFVIDHPHNEASALIIIHNRGLLESLDWDVGFWIVSDENAANEAIAALGRCRNASNRKRDDAAWEVRKVKGKLSKRSTGKTTEDCEALARAGGWIYIFGSQFGSKDGPLDPERHFVARFNEALVRIKDERLKVRIDVARPVFRLHRMINDALRAHLLELIPRGDAVESQFIDATLDHFADRKCGARIERGDWPVNVEGATFLPSGRLLLGLRYPVTSDGHPIVVEIDGIDRFFLQKRKQLPEVTRVLVLSNVGDQDRPRGIRELDQRGSTIHAITGDLDSAPERSVLREGKSEADETASEHCTFELPSDGRTLVKTRCVQKFARVSDVEGLAVDDDGSVWYVRDDERIRLQFAPPRKEPRQT